VSALDGARPRDEERGVGNFQIWGAAGEGAVDAVRKRPVNRTFAFAVACSRMSQHLRWLDKIRLR